MKQDTAAIWRSWEESNRLSKLVEQGQYDDDENGTNIAQKSNQLTQNLHKFVATCSPDSAMRGKGFDFGKADKEDPLAPFVMPPLPNDDDHEERTGRGVDGGEENQREEVVGTFVGLDLRRYMDVCNSPQYRHTHSGTSWTWPMPGPNVSVFVHSSST